MNKFTAAEKAECAERELKLRQGVYTNRAPNGVLSPQQKRQLELMEEIAKDYRAQQERDEADLFSQAVENI